MFSNPLRLAYEVARALMLATLRMLTGRGTGQSWKIQVVLELVRRDLASGPAGNDVVGYRNRERPTPIPGKLLRQVELGQIELGGRVTLDVRPKGWTQEQGTILYFHGGGYCVCSAFTTHRGLIAHLALVSGRRVLAPDYRLAPEHPFPAAFDDAETCWHALLDEGVPAERVALAGDSAGGGLTLATVVRLRDTGAPLPERVALLSPWVDLTLSHATVDQNAASDTLSRELLQWFANHLLQGHDPGDPKVSPLFDDLAGLPPIRIQVGGAETLVGEARDLKHRIEKAGGEVILDEWPKMPHVFQVMAAMVPEANQAMDQLGDWLRRPGAG